MNKTTTGSRSARLALGLIIVFVLAIQNLSFSQTNIDFETGNLNGWTGYIGANMNSNVSFTACSTAVNPPLNGTNLNMIVKSYFSMMTTAAANDPYGNFSLTSPLGGTDVIRLGNENTNVNEGGDCSTPKNCANIGPAYCSTICGTPVGSSYIESPAEAVVQTFAVTSANDLLTYAWAAVLNDGGHPTGEEPYFEVKIYNQAGVEQTCFTNRVIQKTGVTTPGWTKSATKNCWYGSSPAMDVYYKSWTTVNVLLSNYIGQNITVRFAVAGCVDGGHFGYAYFDAKTGPATITPSNASPCGSQTVTLSAPAGVSGPYSWSGPGVVSGASTATVTVNAGGTYTLSVGTGTCVATMTAAVTYSGGPSVTASAGSPTICNGGGPVILTAGGATTYTWSANAGSVTTSTASVNPGSTTIYTVTGTTGGCTGTQTVAVNVTPNPTLTISGTTTLCNGQSTVLTAGTSAGTYTWSANAGGGSASTVTVTPGVGTTTYTLSGDNSGCPGTKTISVTVNPNPTVTIAGSNTVCSGNPVVLSGSTTAGTFTWSANAGGGSAASATVSPTSTTTYTLNGSNGACTASTTIQVTVTPTPTLNVNNATICSGQSTVLTATTATSYQWSANAGSATTSTVSVSPPVGTTVYTVTGSNGACSVTKTATVTVNPTPTLTMATNSYTICNGNSTAITAGGATTYTWTTGTGLNCTVCQTPTASPSGTTVYTVTGTSGGCNSTPQTVTVTVNPIPTLTLTASSNTVCTASSATLTVSGAGTYTWSPAGTLNTANGSPVVATPTATTQYTVTGTSAGCNGNSTITVTVNPTPSITVSPSSATVCPSGSSTLTASGASTYTWSPASTLNTSTGATVVSTPTATQTYTVTGTSAAGCPGTNTVAVTVNPSLAVTVNSPTTCAGIGVVLSANGASSYTWSPAGGLSSTSGATVTATGTVSTSYTVTGSSAGCVGTNTSVVTINPSPTVTVNSSSGAICAGNSTTLTATGASTYTWSPAGSLSSANGSPVVASPTVQTTYTVIGTDANGCKDADVIFVDVSAPPTINAAPSTICSGQSSVLTASGASSYTWSANAGSVTTSTASVNPGSTTVYTVTGTVGTCTSQATTTVTVNPTPTLTMTNNSYTICNGGSTPITAGGATTYTWSNSGGLSCTVCTTPNANPGSTTVYTVSGTTGACISAPATVTVNVNPLPTITAAPSSSAICSSGSATLTASGGVTYTWSPAGDLSSANGSPVVATPTASTTYTVTGTDVNGCVNTNTVDITVAPTPTMSINAVPAAICAGQSVVLNGGTATSYTWSANAGSVNTSSATVTPPVTDTYTLTGSIGSCTNSAVVTVTVNPTPAITNSVITAAPCGQSTGCIDSVMVNGGTPTYTYSYNGGAGSTSPQFCGQPAGNYNLVVTDVNGCTATQVINIPNQNGPSAPTVAVSTASVCVGGTVTMSVTPTSAGIVYTWTDNTGTTTGSSYTVTNINPPGNYTLSVTATDTSINCSNITNTFIVVTALPNISVTATSTLICSGQSTVLSAGGASTYTWSANAGSVNTNTVSVTPGTNTTYTVFGSSNGCNDVQTIDVSVNPTPTVSINASATQICSGNSATLTAGGATNYTWTPGGTTPTITVTPNGTTSYTVTGDSLGCTSQPQVVTVNVTTTPTVAASASSNTICSTQIATLTATGATTYTWLPTGSGGSVVVNPTGNTTYTVIGNNGNCSDSSTVTLNVTPTPTITVAASSPSVCAGQTATLTASGATSYTWMPTATVNDTLTDAPGGTTTYTVTGDNAGCTSAPQQVTVNVNPLPVLTTVGNQTVCSGGSVNAITYSSGGATVNWSNTNTNVGIGASGTGNINGYTAPNVVTQQVGVITATPTNATTGCTGTAQSYTVIVNPLPAANGGQADSALCGAANGGVTGINVTGGTPAYTYQWYNNGVIMPSDTSAVLSGVGTGTYSVLITDANGCTAPASATTFTVSGSPAIVASITPPVSQGPAPLNVTFSNNTIGATYYNWNFGNGQSSTQQAPTAVTYTNAGTYTVIMTATSGGGCISSDTALVIIDAPISIVVPNIYSPNGDGINDTWYITSTGYCELHCDIFNRWGQLVYQLLAVNDEWNGVMNNGNHATEGTYYYILEAKSCIDGKLYKVAGYLTLVK